MNNEKNNNATLCEMTLAERIEALIRRELGFLTRKANLCKDDVDDLFQDTFIKVWTNIDKYSEQKASLNAWISTITKNTFFDLLRKNGVKSSRNVSLSSFDSYDDKETDEEGGLRNSTVTRSDWADEDLQKEELRQSVRDTLSYMNDEDRDLLSMVSDDYDGDVMADRLGISANAVYGRVFRCKNKFKALYKEVA